MAKLLLIFILAPRILVNAYDFNYNEAISKCILFFESQRSGKLPPDQRVTWRGDSALFDGSDYKVGDAQADHDCWERPEIMDTPRTSFQINATNPGSEVAAETAAALASASLVFQGHDAQYSFLMLDRASKLFQFADLYRTSYTDECPFYCSYSGYDDELLWAATWLLKASNDPTYLKYIHNSLDNCGQSAEFSWDNKFAGFSVLLSEMLFKGVESLKSARWRAEYFVCANIPGNSLAQVARTPGGLIYLRPGANTQYSSGAAFLIGVYRTYLLQSNQTMSVTCGDKTYSTTDLLNFVKGQSFSWHLKPDQVHVKIIQCHGGFQVTKAHMIILLYLSYRGNLISRLHTIHFYTAETSQLEEPLFLLAKDLSSIV